MASSPVKFLFALLVFCGLGWIVFVFAARLLAWFLSRILGASVGFRVAGCNCLRDVTIKFKKGSVESISVGEIKLSLRKSLVKLGFSFISRDPKLQLLICDLEVVVRPSERSIKKSKPSKRKKSGSAGRGKWMLLANVARLLSVSVTELVLKVPKAAIEIKDLRVDISKNGGPNPILNIKLYLIPLLVQPWDSQLNFEQCNLEQGDCLLTERNYAATTEKEYAPFICEDFSIACELGHDMDQGIKIKNLDLASGDITINLNENLYFGTKKKPEVSNGADGKEGSAMDIATPTKSQDNKLSSVLRKHIIPDKVSFNLPKLDVKFTHQGQGLSVENNIMGVHLRCSKSIACDDSGDTAAHFDVQLDFSEIHLLRESATSILEILKLSVIASIDVPTQPLLPIRNEIDVKLGGTQCNIIISRLNPWLHLHFSKKKKMVLRDERSHKERFQTTKPKTIMWTCTVSAPEMTIVLYGLNDLPLYHGCSQSSHLFANNIASKGIQVHTELGELHLHMADEYQEGLKESLFSVEVNSGSLLHIARVSLDWGCREESHEENDPNKLKLVFAVDITGMGVFFGFRHVESLVSTLLSFKALFKSLSVSGKRNTHNKVVRSSKSTTKGTHILRINLEKLSVNYCGDISSQDMVVADPKRVNYGSQGGETIITVSADGTPRRATIVSTAPGCKNLKFSASLNIFHFNLCLNKEKHSLHIDIERGRSIYQEYSEENKPGAKVTLLDMQNAKFVRRYGGPNELAVCSLINVTDIAIRWEPDVHLAVFEFITSLKSVVHEKKSQRSDNETEEQFLKFKDVEPVKEALVEHTQYDKHAKKREIAFAIDVEKLKVSAELADGVEAVVYVQSIFSENAKIGVLLEELVLSFNDARLFKSSRMQISRIPVSVPGRSTNAKVQHTTIWDWVIQGPDVQICMPHRLELRAIDDAVEDTLRALKLIAAAKTSLIFPRKDSSKKIKTKSTNFGSFRFIIRKLTVEIEEEPIQGWLDEHYQLMKNEVCELAVRLKFLDELVSLSTRPLGGSEPTEVCSGKKFHYNGIEIDASDTSSIKSLQEEIQKKAFQSYYQACQKLVTSEGSGACREGFQSGFKPSTNRASLLSICATELDVTLNKIEGGEVGMVEFINKMDPVSLDSEIPFSRFYGRDISLTAGTLSVQIRNYTFPIFSATSGNCQGRVVLAQQATCFQPQIQQDVYVGRWWKVRMLRSASGTTPAVKTYSNLPIYFQKGDISFGVGYEPAFADISYAFTVALRRAFLGTRGPNPLENQPPKKERSLPWWDDMRYYIHGNTGLYFSETRWNLLATTNPYEKVDKLQIISGYMEIQQSDGHVCLSAKEFKAYVSSLESLTKNCTLKLPCSVSGPFLYCPAFSIDIVMDWECLSGCPLNHYLHALPKEGKPREKVYDPFRSTSLSLRWNFSMRPSLPNDKSAHCCSGIGDSALVDGASHCSSQKVENGSADSPVVNFGAHDIAWIFKWWNMNYLPPHKLRSFSRWPRYGIARAVRSGNLSLDRVMTEFFLRLDATPACIKHMPLGDDDPASGLTFKMDKLKFERCYSRGKQKFTFDCKRDPLDLVYQGVDLHVLKVYLNRNDGTFVVQDLQLPKKSSQTMSIDKFSNEKNNYLSGCTEKCQDDGFLLYSDYFTIRRQAPKADAARILSWQEAGRRNVDMTCMRSEFVNGSESDHTRSDFSDDDGFTVVVADNCQRVFVYGLKLLWTIENRDAVWSWVGGISKAFAPPKPSPSRQYAQRKFVKGQQTVQGCEMPRDEAAKLSPSTLHGASSPSPQHLEALNTQSFPSLSTKAESSTSVVVNHGYIGDSEEDGTRHFMVNVIQPQFNLHSEEANGRFLLAAASGRVLARSFHSVLHVGYEMMEQAHALVNGNVSPPETQPEMTWKRVELSVMLEQVQAHVAPTDVDPGAGLQWLPKIRRNSPKVKRTGALLERVFMPCQMYFRYTRHKGGTPELKVKPLKELKFNSPNITATMTSRQFQVMLDVLTNLLFARLPKPRKSSLSYPTDDDEDVEEEADEVVPDDVEEVVLARIKIEQRERERKLLLDDIRTLSGDISGDLGVCPEIGDELWMVTGGRSALVHGLKKEFSNIQISRKAASAALRMALQKAAQLRLMEKEKNKSPSYAMRISMRISKVVWSMLADGKSFAEAEINDMIYDFDRDYKDIGVAQFTTKSFVVRNCLPNAKSDMLLSAWNAPPEWGKNVMLRVNAKQGAPKDGSSLLELFQVEIYPLKIHLTETMYRMMWEYFFPEEEQDSQRRQEVWKVSTTAGSKRVRKSTSGQDASSSQSTKESELPGKCNATGAVTAGTSTLGDSSQSLKLPNSRGNTVPGSNPELRRTSSFDKTWEENLAESVANELVLQVHSSSISSKCGSLNSAPESQHAVNEETLKGKSKDSKPVRSGRLSHEEKKFTKSQDDKRARSRKMMEFHNIKISQVELLVTYEGSRFAVNDLRLLMDTFHRDDFTGTWRRLFSRVKKHIIWGVLKSVTGMQGKKFKDKAQSQREAHGGVVPESDLNFSDSDGGQPGKSDLAWLKRPNDGAGDGFVTSIRGLFNSQRRKAKAFVLRTMRGEGENEFHGEWSESDAEFSPFARQLTITKAKKLLRRHTKKFRSRAPKNSGVILQQRESHPSSPREISPYQSDSSGGSSYEDFNE